MDRRVKPGYDASASRYIALILERALARVSKDGPGTI
jgi:hypothetical protein